jgi:histidyl-tRNA synthetase
MAESLRNAGLSVVLHAGGGSFKSQMKRADSSGAGVAVIVGDDEAAAGEASVKSLRSARGQVRIQEQALAQAVKLMLTEELLAG